jgi:opacity protein-like surface antigen
MKKLLLFAVLIATWIGTSQAAWATNYNVGLIDSSTISDSIGSGSFDTGQFTCDSDASNFFCTAGSFTCYGWSNCSALGATSDAPNLATFLDGGDAPELATGVQGATIPTPEPAPLILLGWSLVILLSTQRRRVC